MALHLSVTQVGDQLLVYTSSDVGDPVAIIDHIILSIEVSTGFYHIWKYQDDLLANGRVASGWLGLMFDYTWRSGPAKASATAQYWLVDNVVKSPEVDIT